jgi:hypothetical protein
MEYKKTVDQLKKERDEINLKLKSLQEGTFILRFMSQTNENT